MTWFILILAIVLETIGTTFMKLSDGFSKIVPTVLVFVFYGLSFWALAVTLKKLDVSVAYAIWAGLGTALIAIIGIVGFKEPLTVMKVLSILLIILGVVGLELGSKAH